MGSENVDIASSWEESVQVLEVPACRPDREEIQKQISAKFAEADTPTEKQKLYERLTHYLNSRESELMKE